jgi:hypothetical protein
LDSELIVRQLELIIGKENEENFRGRIDASRRRLITMDTSKL